MVRYLFAFLLLSTGSPGQHLVFTSVEKLSNSINTDAEEIAPHLSADGMTLYFTRLLHESNKGGKYAGSDIYMSRFDVTTLNWKQSENVVDLNTKSNNILIGLNTKGDQLYTLAASSERVPLGFYVHKRVNGVLGKPELIPIENLQSTSFIGAYLTPEQDVLIVSIEAEDSKGQEDLYVSVKSNNKWSPLINMGSSINTKGFEISPFLSADKKRLYFSSNGHPGEGGGDLFYCDRLYSSWEAWSSPVNLGKQINSVGFDAYLAIYGDSVAFFSSNRGTGLPNTEIYKCTVATKTESPDIVLSLDEVKEIFGTIDSRLIFNGNNTGLTASHRELLWYLGNKLMDNKTIKLIILVSPDVPANISEARVEAIIGQLANTGLEGSRIQRGVENQALENPNAIQLVFTRIAN